MTWMVHCTSECHPAMCYTIPKIPPLTTWEVHLCDKCDSTSNNSSRGLASPLTHYRSFRDNFYRSYDRINSVKALKETSWSCRYGLNPTRTTPPCYNNITLGNRLYSQRKGPNVTNPICWTCKNCSHECAADCEHCVTQPSTEQFW